jgi:hypothetical protein
MKGQGLLQKDCRMHGPWKQSHHLPERLVLCFLLLILHSMSRNCEWCAEFYRQPALDTSVDMAYGSSNTVSSRQRGHKQRERALKISHFPRSVTNLNRKSSVTFHAFLWKQQLFKLWQRQDCLKAACFRYQGTFFSTFQAFPKKVEYLPSSWWNILYILNLRLRGMGVWEG